MPLDIAEWKKDKLALLSTAQIIDQWIKWMLLLQAIKFQDCLLGSSR